MPDEDSKGHSELQFQYENPHSPSRGLDIYRADPEIHT